VLAATVLASCGGDADDGGGGTTTGEGGAATAEAATPAEGSNDATPAASSDAPAGPSSDCPFGADQVSDVLGVTMEKEPDLCMFSGPSHDVTYVQQVPFACGEAVVGDAGFEMEAYEGLGVDAYESTVGTELLVCTDPPFEIVVDITPSLDDLVADATAASAKAEDAELAAVEQLARLVLAGG